MPTYSVDLLINLLASLLFFVLGFGVSRIVRHCSLGAPLRRTWQLKPNTDKHIDVQIIAATLSQQENAYDRPGTGMGEVQAYAAVRESLLAAYGDGLRLRFTFSRDYLSQLDLSPKNEPAHVISLGGRKYNEVTAYFRDRYSQLPLWVEHNGREPVEVVLCRGEEQKRYRPVFRDGELTTDYGIVSRLPALGGNRDSTVFLVEGVRTYGVGAAGLLFLPPLISELHTLTKQAKCRYWQALVTIDVGSPDAIPRLLTSVFRPLDDAIESQEVLS